MDGDVRNADEPTAKARIRALIAGTADLTVWNSEQWKHMVKCALACGAVTPADVDAAKAAYGLTAVTL
jgi:hypothetical protein